MSSCNVHSNTGDQLAALYASLLAAEREQTSIDQSLDVIEQQQKDLSSTLEAYEKVTDEILGGQGGGANLRALDTGPADTERDKKYVVSFCLCILCGLLTNMLHSYILATELHGHLDDLSGSLSQMIEAVNELSNSSDNATASNDDPMTQIAQVLSNHLESLQWIDGAVKEVDSKVTEVERRVKAAGGEDILNGSGYGGGPGVNKSRGFGISRS